jgi:NAD(P)-dependent dehydrogenase (short-subunit alcohol dehydrogenase family)
VKPLEHLTAIVTGASRGAGRGIAVVLGEAGATVYVTGRSTRGGTRTEELPGTIEDTAEEVTARGGKGIAVRCDHTRQDDLDRLTETVAKERKSIGLLVNNAWGGYEGSPLGIGMKPFWEEDPVYWDRMFARGVLPALLTSRAAAPLLLANGQGLIINTVAWLEGKSLGNIYYDLAKNALIRAVYVMADALRGNDVSAVALAPGFLRSERVMAAHAQHPFDLGQTESPEYIGRAVRALAADTGVMRCTGQLLYVGDLAKEYGFTDIDGRQPPKFRVG